MSLAAVAVLLSVLDCRDDVCNGSWCRRARVACVRAQCVWHLIVKQCANPLWCGGECCVIDTCVHNLYSASQLLKGVSL